MSIKRSITLLLLTAGLQFFIHIVSFSQSWTPKADFAGGGRYGAVGFSIGTKGYIGTGHDGTVYKQDFWEWDQATDTWTQKADFPATPRVNAVGFSIGTKGYIGTGVTSATAITKDFGNGIR